MDASKKELANNTSLLLLWLLLLTLCKEGYNSHYKSATANNANYYQRVHFLAYFEVKTIPNTTNTNATAEPTMITCALSMVALDDAP
ncbi:MAG: hypothetical protein LBG47_01595 [Prevotellaceae bacterium]|jgi:hypothetical protein|nr:hypothetical protein [Prevotellaceae bacterium]